MAYRGHRTATIRWKLSGRPSSIMGEDGVIQDYYSEGKNATAKVGAIVGNGAVGERQRPDVFDPAPACGVIARDSAVAKDTHRTALILKATAIVGIIPCHGAVGEKEGPEVFEPAPDVCGDIIGNGAVGERQRPAVEDATTVKHRSPTTQGQPHEGEMTRGRHMEETKTQSAGRPFDAGGLCSHNGQ